MAGVIKAESEESSCVPAPLQQSSSEVNDDAVPSSSRAGSSEDNEASASPANSSNASDEEATGNEYPPIFQEVSLHKFPVPFSSNIILIFNTIFVLVSWNCNIQTCAAQG